jgi:acyl-CoA synthetase (AMP-forming)/AMP-acid ligase II
MPRFDARDFVDVVARHGITVASLAATMLHSLLEVVEGRPDLLEQLASLRLIGYGAAPMPVPLLQRAHDVLGVDFTSGFGMTELAGNAVFLDVDAHRRGLAGDPALLATTGTPAPGVSVRVVDDEDCDVEPGATGEVLVRGAQVMTGYWDEPDATAEALRGGWLHTGDIGRFDVEGNLAIVDRKKDVIVTGGENVSSLEVEQVLHGVAGVGEVAVVGVPDDRWGENVCAVIVPRIGMTVDPEEVVRVARAHLAGFKAPRHVVIAEALPKNATGKIVKAELRAWLAAQPELLGGRR